MVPWWNTHKPGSNHKEALYDLKIKECLQNYQDKLFKVVNGKKHKEEAETNSGELEDLRQSVKCSSGRGGTGAKWLWSRGWQTISAKIQIVSILGFMGHMVSVSTSQLCGYEVKTTRDIM